MKRTAKEPKVRLVVRWSPTFSLWYLCHTKSYQNAYRNDVNGFKTMDDAVKFANGNGHTVEHHEHDQLQAY